MTEHPCQCAAGKTGSARGYGRFDVRRNEDETWSARSLVDSMQMGTGSWCGRKYSVNTMARTQCRSLLRMKIIGAHRLAGTTNTVLRSHRRPPVSYSHATSCCGPQTLSMHQTSKRCWRLDLKRSDAVSRLARTQAASARARIAHGKTCYRRQQVRIFRATSYRIRPPSRALMHMGALAEARQMGMD